MDETREARGVMGEGRIHSGNIAGMVTNKALDKIEGGCASEAASAPDRGQNWMSEKPSNPNVFDQVLRRREAAQQMKHKAGHEFELLGELQEAMYAQPETVRLIMLMRKNGLI